jgi:hypothetical protein
MERESFEDNTTASIMNKYFVNIKVDRYVVDGFINELIEIYLIVIE